MTQPSAAGGTAAAPPLACQRSDIRQGAIVDRAIAMQAQSNTVSAIEFLKSHGVDARLIERVLLDPHRRRSFPH